MRTEREMLDLILETARQDERVRAVVLNGSRANPAARRDFFQDFDIVYLVTDSEPFRNNREWIRRFGELMILQIPDDMVDGPPGPGHGFGYLMQFTDGNRIDLGIYPLKHLEELKRDSLSVLLLDKDGLLPPFPPASDADYLPKPPTATEFDECCNEFWWCCPYVAKGLWREELVYARYMFDGVVREQLVKMLTWYVGVQTGFQKNPGSFGKNLQKYLEPELWEMLLKTYAAGSYEATWEALLTTCELFRRVATRVGEHFGVRYPLDEDRRVSAHLQHVRALPKDAAVMYP